MYCSHRHHIVPTHEDDLLVSLWQFLSQPNKNKYDIKLLAKPCAHMYLCVCVCICVCVCVCVCVRVRACVCARTHISQHMKMQDYILCIENCVISTRNGSWPLAIFQSISTFGQPKSILIGQIYYTFVMRQQSITYKMSDLQNKWPTNF